jgi:hypothetical protein
LSRHHTRAGWTPKVAQRHERRNRASLPALCVNGCGRLITPDMTYGIDWENGHFDNLAEGGSVKLTGPAHVKCNRGAGGRLGASITNGRRRARDAEDKQQTNGLRPW